MTDFWDDASKTLASALPVIRQLAPTVATCLGGPLAGAAVSALSNAILGKPDGTAQDVAAAMVTATPDQLLKLRQEEDSFKARMAELQLEADKLVAADRDSARQREVKSGDSATPRFLAAGVTLGFFGILALMMFHEVPASGRDVLLAMTGTLGTAWVAVVSYYFGSSAGSADKTAALTNLANRP